MPCLRTLRALNVAVIPADVDRFVSRPNGLQHFPINPSHAKARRAAEGASCAAKQGRFWPMHDFLFGSEGKLADADLRVYAGTVGLDVVQFNRCMDADGMQVVADDMQLAASLGLRVTPTFLVGRREEPDIVRVTSILEGLPAESIFETASRTTMQPRPNLRPGAGARP